MITADELTILRKPEVQEYIREKMGPWEEGDQLYDLVTREHCFARCDDDWIDGYILIPDCISRDSSRPERGLHGMIDWQLFWYEVTRKGKYRVFRMSNKTAIADWIEPPRLALLKALLWQIERGKP